ncbi:MAG TPA: hypothetical protein VE981_09705 [Planctomycetota bacterium]|nr:hypothetical protein [Planctomycetota bacterium]
MTEIDPRLLALLAAPDEDREAAYDLIDGVVHHIEVSFRNYRDHATELYALAPIRHLTLRDGDATDVAAFFGSKEISRLKSILIHSAPVTDAELEILALSPHPTELRWLTFYEGRATFAGLRSMAESLSLERLVHLDPGRESEGVRKAYYTDWDGSIADSHFPKTGELLERWYGPIPWLIPDGPDAPDRFAV